MPRSSEYLPGSRSTPQDRRNEYDVTNTICVSSASSVRDEVLRLFQEIYPNVGLDAIWIAFHDFELLFDGRLAGYLGCDTVYHDKQHSLDISLAMARLLVGYERSSAANDRLGAERAILGIIAALFHDAGYIRRTNEPRRMNGAEFTLWHVSRSAEFLKNYMAGIGMGETAQIAAQIVHFTGYEINLDDIELENPKDSMIGHFLGTADLMAQMADRCYLEKCRDRLYSEFVLAGIAIEDENGGPTKVMYESGIDLLKKTPEFFGASARQRLDRKFNRSYRYIEALYDGRNPYMEFISQNLDYLGQVIAHDDWRALRREPPCFTVLEKPLQSVSALVSGYLANHNAPASALATP